MIVQHSPLPIQHQSSQRKNIHPHKFALWVAMGSIIMMFAGLTSAFIVKSNQPKWITFDMPVIFWYSTAALIVSSVMMQMALIKFKERRMGVYRNFLSLTVLLGMLFIALQLLGFYQLWQSGVTLKGAGAAPLCMSFSGFMDCMWLAAL